jgi:hypothetical protein
VGTYYFIDFDPVGGSPGISGFLATSPENSVYRWRLGFDQSFW